ncbi:hypothetical protein E2C01_099080 [Portunus trituberculatus]|uniref:Uncharacterized protein n=1 Tax=Portunus trituberculatus TaxID=210409 RepID=A0A5B7K2W9_PORTR|nr:hypothetical protein [Portunus trituberculatus]
MPSPRPIPGLPRGAPLPRGRRRRWGGRPGTCYCEARLLPSPAQHPGEPPRRSSPPGAALRATEGSPRPLLPPLHAR